MTLAMDARWLTQPLHGIARYSLNLLRELPLKRGESLWVLYNRADFNPADLGREGLIWIDCGVPLFSPQEPVAMTRLLHRLQPSLLHVPSYWMPYHSPCPWLMTIHDLIHLQENSLKYRLYYAWLRRRLRSAAGILTVSKASAAEIKQWCGLDSTVTYPGYESAYTSEASASELQTLQHWGVQTPYFFYIGNPKPHKRFELALAASQQLIQQGQTHTLVSVGVPESGEAFHLALKNVSESLMPVLYRHAQALLLPSRLEGFGLPGIEALASGCPVLAADIPVFREVIPQAEFVADQVDDWAAGMSRYLVLSEQQKLQLNLKRPDYSWVKMAQGVREVYNRCL